MMNLRTATIVILLALGLNTNAQVKHKDDTYVRIKTAYGECIIRLYNETPLHKDNFLKLVKQRYFDKTFFHRVIKDFVAQGGDPDTLFVSTHSKSGVNLDERISPEFHEQLFHKRGVLAAGRDDNKEKTSFVTQFYLVAGKKWTDQQLDEIEIKRMGGRKIPKAQREVYKTIGGTPFLDQNYTVFGEVVKGIELIDKITGVKTLKDDSPVKEIPMQIVILKRGEIMKLYQPK